MEMEGSEYKFRGIFTSPFYLLSVLSFFLACLSKETALTLPLFLIVYDYLRGDRRWRYWIDSIKQYIPFLITAITYLLLRSQALGEIAPRVSMHPYLTTYQNIINIFPLLIKYLTTLLFPINLTPFHVLNPAYSLLEAKVLVALLLTLAIRLNSLQAQEDTGTVHSLFFSHFTAPFACSLYTGPWHKQF